MTLGRTRVAELLAENGLAARRSLGQNFVADPGTVRRIVREAGVGPGSAVVEVGPGVGSLTLALVEAGARVLAVEKDPSLLGVLAEVTAGADPAPRVVQGDALVIDWKAELAAAAAALRGADGAPTGPWTMVANLPYNVAVPIVLHALATAPAIERLVVMVQKEVAERLCAEPGGRVIGIPTIKAGWWAAARTVMRVPPEVFVPVPRVDSAVVRLDRRDPPADEAVRVEAFRLLDAAYRQRRKMLRSSLSGMVDAQLLGARATARPEELSVGDWAELATASLARRDGDGAPVEGAT